MSRTLFRIVTGLAAVALATSSIGASQVSAGPLGIVTIIPIGVDEPDERKTVHAISPDGSLVLFESADSSIGVWSRADNSIARLDELTGQSVGNPVFGSAGAAIYFVVGPVNNRQAYRWTVEEGLEALPFQSAFVILDASADGSTVLFQTLGDDLARWSDADGAEVVAGVDSSWLLGDMSDDGSTVAFGQLGPNGSVDVWRWSGGDPALIASLATDLNFGGLALSEDGRTLAFNGFWDGRSTVLRYRDSEGLVDIGRGIPEAIGTMPDSEPYREVRPEVFGISSDGNTVAISNSCCAFVDEAPAHSFLWTESAGLNLLQKAGREQTSYMGLSRDGSTAVTTLGGVVTVWRDGRPAVVRGSQPASDFGFAQVGISADGSTVVSSYFEWPDQSAPVWGNMQVWSEFGNHNSIEQLIRSDAFDDDTDPEVLRLYRAFFNREPDVAGAAYWLDIRDTTDSLTIAREFTVASAEFANTYADAANDTEFLNRVYDHVLGRQPDQDGFDYWLDILAGTDVTGNNPSQGQLDRGTVVYYIALSKEFVNTYPYSVS